MPFCIDMRDVCVAPAYRAVTEQKGTVQVVDGRGRAAGMPRPSEVKRLGVYVSTWDGDVVERYSAIGMTSLAAGGGLTIYYVKSCEQSGWTCRYAWSTGPTGGRPYSFTDRNDFTIKADSAAAFGRAEKNLWLKIGPVGSPAYVSVSALKVRLDGFEISRCNSIHPQAGCPDEDTPRRRRLLESEAAGRD